jgi:hypothetical protein
MLGKNGIKVFDHIFPQKLTLTFLGNRNLLVSDMLQYTMGQKLWKCVRFPNKSVKIIK